MDTVIRVHPAIRDPDSVTHYVCADGEQATSIRNTPHHMTALNRCRYCHKPAGVLRAEQSGVSRHQTPGDHVGRTEGAST